MEEETVAKKKMIITILTIATIVIYVAIFFIIEKDDREKSRLSAEIVTNYSEFYTVSSCANKYIGFLSSKNANSLLNVLSDSYKKKNFITESNVTDSLPIIVPNSTFTANRMYYEKVGEQTYKYYISGFLETSGLDMKETSRVKSYLIIYLDKEKTLFSVEPYDGKEYEEGIFE